MSLSNFIILAFCVIDDECKKLKIERLRQRGFEPSLTDSETITMEIVGEFLGKDRLTKEDDFQNLTVYLPTPTGVRWVNGGKQRQIFDTNPPDVQQLLLTAKVYLGYHEEFVAGSPPIEKWKNLLRPEEKEAILEHVRMKGSSSQGVKLRAYGRECPEFCVNKS